MTPRPLSPHAFGSRFGRDESVEECSRGNVRFSSQAATAQHSALAAFVPQVAAAKSIQRASRERGNETRCQSHGLPHNQRFVRTPLRGAEQPSR
jgi:hypothetical protein